MKEQSSGTSVVLLLGQCYGEHWNRIVERVEDDEVTLHSLLMTGLWATREPVTFDAFHRWFNLKTSNTKEFRVIAAVMEHESTLPCIKFIADILAWQSFLFSVLPSTTTREQVSCADCMHSR